MVFALKKDFYLKTSVKISLKKAFVLPLVLLMLSVLSFMLILNVNFSSQTPRLYRDLTMYLQAELLSFEAKNLAKYLIFKAKEQGKECLNYTLLEYPTKYDLMEFEFFYPLAECNNFKLEPHLNSQKIIAVSVNILLNANSKNEKAAVNDEIFLHESFYLYPDF